MCRGLEELRAEMPAQDRHSLDLGAILASVLHLDGGTGPRGLAGGEAFHRQLPAGQRTAHRCVVICCGQVL